MVNDELSLLRLYSEEHIIRQGYVMANELFLKIVSICFNT